MLSHSVRRMLSLGFILGSGPHGRGIPHPEGEQLHKEVDAHLATHGLLTVISLQTFHSILVVRSTGCLAKAMRFLTVLITKSYGC